MRVAVLLGTIVASLALVATASAGCMATVGLSSLPAKGQRAGEPWLVTVRILQHGRRPMTDAKPVVRIRSARGKLVAFKARRAVRAGSYHARVVFPFAGRWRLAVYDGFPVAECAREHTFTTVTIAPSKL